MTTPEAAINRRTGRTTRQMKDAPKCAHYVWMHWNLEYPRLLARSIGRSDLNIVPPSWLESAIGLRPFGLVVDHAAQLTDRQWEARMCIHVCKEGA